MSISKKTLSIIFLLIVIVASLLFSSIFLQKSIEGMEINDEEDLKSLSQGKSINIDENKLKNISSKILDDKIIFISNRGDIVSFGKLTGNLFKPNKILI